jgi:hypothetical protein
VGVCILLRILDQVQGFLSNGALFQNVVLFYSNYPLHVSGVKMVVRPKHVADNLNKIVKKY